VKEVGSTGCSAIAWTVSDDKAHNEILNVKTANLGDSYAYAVIMNEDHSIAETVLLNRLHKPDDEKEKAFIEKNGGRVANWGCARLNGDLALSRAFCDTRHEDDGINHEPEIELYEKKLAQGQEAFIVVASDGLELNNDAIGKIFHETYQKSPAELTNIRLPLI
jgi:serine/threonine protein phosphatase PrpC